MEIGKLYVEELNDVNSDGTIKRAYQLQNIENQQLNARVQDKSLAPSTSTADVDIVSDLFSVVKQKDKDFNPKEVNPAFLNEDGTPRIVYHGTSEKFTIFDRTKGRSSMDIQGMFFSPWEHDAKGYGGNEDIRYAVSDSESETGGKEYFVPVRFGTKEMTDGKFMLYVILSDKKIRAGIANERFQAKAQTADISPNSEYSIAQIIKDVNSKDILKYMPERPQCPGKKCGSLRQGNGRKKHLHTFIRVVELV